MKMTVWHHWSHSVNTHQVMSSLITLCEHTPGDVITDHTLWTHTRWCQTVDYTDPRLETMCTHTQTTWSSIITDHTLWTHTRWCQTVDYTDPRLYMYSHPDNMVLCHHAYEHTPGEVWQSVFWTWVDTDTDVVFFIQSTLSFHDGFTLVPQMQSIQTGYKSMCPFLHNARPALIRTIDRAKAVKLSEGLHMITKKSFFFGSVKDFSAWTGGARSEYSPTLPGVFPEIYKQSICKETKEAYGWKVEGKRKGNEILFALPLSTSTCPFLYTFRLKQCASLLGSHYVDSQSSSKKRNELILFV